LLPLALPGPQPGEADRGAQLERARLLPTRDVERTLKRIRRCPQGPFLEGEHTGEPVQIGLVPALARVLCHGPRFGERAQRRLTRTAPRQRFGQQGKIIRHDPRRSRGAPGIQTAPELRRARSDPSLSREGPAAQDPAAAEPLRDLGLAT
jgi:hypothetical protein